MAREMKDSGIAWIGEIPCGWKISKVNWFFDIQLGKMLQPNKETETDTYEDYLSAINLGGNKLKLDKIKQMWFSTAEKINLSIKKDDLLVVEGGDVASSDIVDIDLPNIYYQNSLHRVRAIREHDIRIIRYLLLLAKSTGYIDLICNKATIAHFSKEKFLSMPYILMPISEQKSIADFLDKKCTEIDAILDSVRLSIEEYKKLKQSIITQAVTKGIRGDRPMKDSGIEWVKQLPLEWHSINPKALFTQRKERAKEGERQLTASQQYGVIYQDEYMELTGTRVVTVQKDFDILKHVEVGDFVISMRSFQGGLEYSTRSGSISSAYVMLRPNLELVYSRFFRWLLKSSLYINAIQSTSDLVRDGQAMRYSNFAQVRLYTVPMDEQKEIADYLDRKCAEIDIIIEQKSKNFSELEAYKKSLIYEYITGKKEVPQTYPESVITFVDARALLMCRIIELLKPKGRIHLMKALFCVDCLLDFNRKTQYLRQKHGPYDEQIEEYEKVLVQKGWASIKNGKSVDYILTETFETYREAYQIYYGSLDAEIQRICEFLRPMKTSQAERVATLLAVWNDFIIDGFSPTDKQIVQEVRSNWTPNKANSPESTWMDTLTKMKMYHITPSGYGKHTAHMNENR